MNRILSALVGTALAGTALVDAQLKDAAWLQANFQARSHTSPTVTMVYRLYKPANYDATKKYPIVVALHGIGERGNNNVNQLTLEELAQPWVRDSVQAKHPHFVMIPQCPSGVVWWAGNGFGDAPRSAPNIGVTEILDSLKREFSLDTTRFYAVGLSMGGFGTFELMKWRPELFAAAVPAAGGGDTLPPAITNHLRTPFWAFHGSNDGTVNVSGSRNIVNRVEARGKAVVRFTSSANRANPTAISVDSLRKAVYEDSADFLYSEVTGGNHAAGWFEAWRHPMVTDWVFSKRKVDGVTTSVSPSVTARAAAPANVRVVFREGRTLLEKTVGGRAALFTLDGKRATALPASGTAP